MGAIPLTRQVLALGITDGVHVAASSNTSVMESATASVKAHTTKRKLQKSEAFHDETSLTIKSSSGWLGWDRFSRTAMPS
jgi:hypothetical protein